MLDYTIQVEHWAYDTTKEFEKLTAVFEVPLNADTTAHFLGRARTLLLLTEKYHDASFIKELGKELTEVCSPPNKSQKIVRYISYVNSLFGEFWLAAQKFEERYSYPSAKKMIEGELEEILFEIRSFVKHATWDADPYNFDPTIESILNDHSEPDSENEYSVSSSKNGQSPQPVAKLQWKGDNTDLAELIWALTKSGRVGDTITGQPVTQRELTSRVIDLLGLDSLNIADLMRGRYGTATKSTTYKAQGGKTFVNSLQTLLDQRILD